jgi:hypothetical protein
VSAALPTLLDTARALADELDLAGAVTAHA